MQNNTEEKKTSEQEKKLKKLKIYKFRTGVSGVSAGNPCNIPACPLSA
jgi:hypothetical protein